MSVKMAASMSMLLSYHSFRHLSVQFNHVAKFSRFSKLLTNAPSLTGEILKNLILGFFT